MEAFWLEFLPFAARRAGRAPRGAPGDRGQYALVSDRPRVSACPFRAGRHALFFAAPSLFPLAFAGHRAGFSTAMKKIAAVVLMSLGALLAGCGKNESAQPAAAAAPATPPAAVTKIVIGLDDNFPPMGFRDEKNQLVGFDIDMAREAARRMGVEVEFKPIDWSAKEAELSGKRVDALWNGLTITEERKQNIAFTAPYMENHQIIVVAAQAAIKTKADLAGKVVGAQDGSSAVDAVKKEDAVFKSFKEFKTFGDNVTALMDLSTGRLEAVVVDEVVGRYYVAKKPQDYAVLDEHFGTEEYGVGVRKDDTALQGRLDKALGDMKQDGAAATIATQWFGKNIIK
ncbi:amino acid ABC transporter substrate-binding protein, PAAT family [Paracidovorax konjaci]|uniref:Amino acid ABC transporter substrate-binding protein, PAAT family n=2 Tax=Paracidovorax konjaci TaxID=32040 RepID=A0A1I1RLE5_9BURK|nr:amino acid ABC transporter substrate-binding protein, PAAT family [Paracidovorax konjaci]